MIAIFDSKTRKPPIFDDALKPIESAYSTYSTPHKNQNRQIHIRRPALFIRQSVKYGTGKQKEK